MRFWVYLMAAVAIVAWGIERAIRSRVFDVLKALPTADQLFLSSLGFLSLLILLIWNQRRPGPDRSKRETAALIVGVALLGLIGAFLVYEATNKTPVVATIAIAAATVGWMIQRQTAIENSRKQHTLNILLQMRQNELWNRHRTNLFAHFPYGTAISESDVSELLAARTEKENYKLLPDGKQVFPVIESIYFICNYNEFLASAVRQGDIDSELLRQSLEGVIKGLYVKCEPILEAEMKLDGKGRPTATTYSNYWWLVKEHWK